MRRLLVAALLLVSACKQGGVDPHDGADAAAGGGDIDGGPGDPDAAPGAQTACDPFEARSPAPQLLIGPTGLEAKILEQIDGADESIQVLMYQLALDSFIDAFIAAEERGVDVQIVVDGNQPVNDDARTRLTAAGVGVRNAPAQFTNAHAKVLLIDDSIGIVLSGNLNYFTMNSERNYGVIDRDPEDVADLRAVFAADWSEAASDFPDLACTRLVVSPVNSRTRLLDLIERAEDTLDLSVMYLSDEDVVAAVEARAAAGVEVRVLLADPGWIDGNAESATTLGQHGIPVKFMTNYELHAKLVVADGVAFVGSENFSWTSLNKNREVGVFVTESGPAGQAAAQFASDWAAGDLP